MCALWIGVFYAASFHKERYYIQEKDMNIAIIGYGKMGKAVEQAAKARGHKVVSIIDVNNKGDFDSAEFKSADVAIEFSVSESVWDNIQRSWAAGVPVVSGTTGWLTPMAVAEVTECCAVKGEKLLTAPNFSLGVNVAMAANRLLANLFAPYGEYTVGIKEAHHIHKKDHPSGTAILFANGIVEENSRYDVWVEDSNSVLPSNAVPISYDRRGEVAGIHEVKWDGPSDILTLRHEAKNREGFATGAVIAAEWLKDAPKGHHYTMTDVLKNKM